ncbi:MAG: membrane protein insertion efficiency factor YidD [Puniceicoccales bacterium]|nr:membrane protein insertion efficiency factor YidD [Puniceicoccales bacterium]
MKLVGRLLIFFIRIYQIFLSPLKLFLFGPHCRCRFLPTCSQFAVRVLQKYHYSQAFYFIIRRIIKCHPFHR